MRGVFAVLALLILPLASIASAQAPVDVVYNVFSIDDTIDSWQASHPDLVERFTLGQSVGMLPLHGLVITDESVAFDAAPLSTGHKSTIYLDGGHHGNEYLGVQLLMYWVEDLLAAHAAGDDRAKQLLATTEFHVVPLLNPDGNLRDTRYNGRLVDLNRNYDFGWEGSCFLVAPLCFKGDAPHSEPEIAANVAYVTALSPDLWVSTHTGIETLFWPQGNADTPGDPFVPHAPDIGVFEAMEPGFENATGGRIDAYGGPAAAVGSAEDFGYGKLGIPSYVYEVHNDQFFPAYTSPMRDMLAAQSTGLDYLVDHALRMGAWVEYEDGAFVNHGWGPARNVTITSAAGTSVIPEIDPGAAVAIGLDGEFSWSYPALLVDTSRIRTHHGQAGDGADSEASPAAALVAGAAAMVALAAIRRRR